LWFIDFFQANRSFEKQDKNCRLNIESVLNEFPGFFTYVGCCDSQCDCFDIRTTDFYLASRWPFSASFPPLTFQRERKREREKEERKKGGLGLRPSQGPSDDLLSIREPFIVHGGLIGLHNLFSLLFYLCQRTLCFNVDVKEREKKEEGRPNTKTFLCFPRKSVRGRPFCASQLNCVSSTMSTLLKVCSRDEEAKLLSDCKYLWRQDFFRKHFADNKTTAFFFKGRQALKSTSLECEWELKRMK